MQENKIRRRKGEGYVFKVKNTFYLQYRDAAGIKHAFTLKRPTGEKITEDIVFHTDATAYAHWRMDITMGSVVFGATAALALVIVAVSVLFVRKH